jgi:hypothetical protein
VAKILCSNTAKISIMSLKHFSSIIQARKITGHALCSLLWMSPCGLVSDLRRGGSLKSRIQCSFSFSKSEPEPHSVALWSPTYTSLLVGQHKETGTAESRRSG